MTEKASAREPLAIPPIDVREARIGFIGLGVMGAPMARNVRGAGFAVTVYDVSSGALEREAGVGQVVATDMRTLVADSDVVVSVLPDTPQVREVVNDDGGILSAARPGTVFIDMWTISPIASRELSRDLAAAGIPMLDAPVSGGVQKAHSGELSIMVGGEEPLHSWAAELFASMGSSTWMGPAGSGQATKACNQVAVGLGIQAIAEAFTLGSQLGLDLDRLYTALRGGSCSSFLLDNLGPLMLEGDDSPGFRVALQLKDLKIANESALSTSTPLPGLSTVLNLYMDAVANGQASDGNQSLARVYERHSGARIGKKAYASADAAAH